MDGQWVIFISLFDHETYSKEAILFGQFCNAYLKELSVKVKCDYLAKFTPVRFEHDLIFEQEKLRHFRNWQNGAFTAAGARQRCKWAESHFWGVEEQNLLGIYSGRIHWFNGFPYKFFNASLRHVLYNCITLFVMAFLSRILKKRQSRSNAIPTKSEQ